MGDHAVHGLHDDDHDVQRNGQRESAPVASGRGMMVMVAMAMPVAVPRVGMRTVVVVRVRIVVMVMAVVMIIALVPGMSTVAALLRRRFLVVEPDGRVLVVTLFGCARSSGTSWFAIVAHQTDS
jgi:hypothetical protein